MDSPRLTRLPPAAPDLDPDRLLTDLVAAVDLVAAGIASRVVVANADGIDSVAARAVAYASACGVAFRVDRPAAAEPGAVVGPRIR